MRRLKARAAAKWAAKSEETLKEEETECSSVKQEEIDSTIYIKSEYTTLETLKYENPDNDSSKKKKLKASLTLNTLSRIMAKLCAHLLALILQDPT